MKQKTVISAALFLTLAVSGVAISGSAARSAEAQANLNLTGYDRKTSGGLQVAVGEIKKSSRSFSASICFDLPDSKIQDIDFQITGISLDTDQGQFIDATGSFDHFILEDGSTVTSNDLGSGDYGKLSVARAIRRCDEWTLASPVDVSELKSAKLRVFSIGRSALPESTNCQKVMEMARRQVDFAKVACQDGVNGPTIDVDPLPTRDSSGKESTAGISASDSGELHRAVMDALTEQRRGEWSFELPTN